MVEIRDLRPDETPFLREVLFAGVDHDNPARRLYARLAYAELHERDDDDRMFLDLG